MPFMHRISLTRLRKFLYSFHLSFSPHSSRPSRSYSYLLFPLFSPPPSSSSPLTYDLGYTALLRNRTFGRFSLRDCIHRSISDPMEVDGASVNLDISSLSDVDVRTVKRMVASLSNKVHTTSSFSFSGITLNSPSFPLPISFLSISLLLFDPFRLASRTLHHHHQSSIAYILFTHYCCRHVC